MIKTITVSLVVFIVVFSLGMLMAKNKAMINDEIHSQVHSIDAYSYKQILFGKIIGEGNNCPLFYLIQKSLCDLVNFKSPQNWVNGVRLDKHDFAQIYLRLNPIFFISLAAASLFFYIYYRFSLLAALMSLIAFFSIDKILVHWADARHYALWIALSIIQLLLLFELLMQEGRGKKLITALIFIHLLLSMTVILSLGSILLTTLLIYQFKEKRIRYHFFLAVLPTALGLYYYKLVPHYKYWLPHNSLFFVFDCFPYEHLIFIALCMALFSFLLLSTKITEKSKNMLFASYKLSAFILFMLLSGFALWWGFKMGDTQNIAGNQISSRYFLFLTPTAITGISLLLAVSLKFFRHNTWMQLNIIIIFLGLMLNAYLQNYSLWVILEFLRTN